ncbi:MAG TPA: radical SAM protein [Candidatus Omnitrophota bacterium]|nr:radical SAM protein [Candidatus Omnitrophota bacterium]
MGRKLDIVLVNPGDKKQVYQDLSRDYSAIEPPFWVAVIAGYLRDKGFNVGIIDANEKNITPDEAAQKVFEADALLAAIIVYGSQPSASTQNMTAAINIARAIKKDTSVKLLIGGLHPSALPERTLIETGADYLIEGEGFYTLESLLAKLKAANDNYSDVLGLWYRKGSEIVNNARAPLIEDLDKTLPMAAWDLLPMDKYKAHNWHCFDNLNSRMPYAAIYTSFGCPYSCVFCCINSIFGQPGIRYRKPELVVEELGLLLKKYGVRNIKIADELFVYNEKHYMSIVDLIIQNGFDLNIWAYARVDTIKPGNLSRMKKAGINWLALGIESASSVVRDGVSKRIKAEDIKETVRIIQDAGIRVMGNFIFGLPDDDLSTMQETLDLALELNCEFINFYSAMAYPGSKLYNIALAKGWELPKEWHGFSQHSFETLPLATKYISAREVLAFRDEAFHRYFNSDNYLQMIEGKFGREVKEHVINMTKTRLKRRIFSDYSGL